MSTVLQARRVGRVGAGYVLVMGTSGAFIAICVAAIAQGGPAMLAILVVISSLFQFLLAWRLSLLRRILTPTVAGTVIMLIPVTVMPIVFGMLTQAPADTVLLGLLFVVGMRIVIQDGIDYRKGLIAGVAFWIGVGFQNGAIFPEHIAGIAGGLLDNGITAGGVVAILLTLFVELTEPRRRRIQAPFEVASLPEIRAFLETFAARSGWGEAMAQRLGAAAEEALLTLLRHEDEEAESGVAQHRRRLLLTAHKGGRRRGARVHRRTRRAEPGRPDRHALGADRRGAGGPGDIAQAAAPPRLIGPPPAVSRHRHRDDPRGGAGAGPRLSVIPGTRPPGG